MFSIFTVVLAALASPTAAQPGQMTLRDLSTFCSGNIPSEACRFYILGVMEGTSLASGVAKDRAHFCTPDGVTQTEVVAVVKRMIATDLKRFPGDAAIPAVSFIGATLITTYPCNSK